MSGYTDGALKDWAGRIRAWAGGQARPGAPLVTPHVGKPIRDIFVYFDNDAKVKAPGDARRLRELLAGGA